MSDTYISSETLTAFRSELADRYKIERELGRGGMATVYLAHDLVNDRRVAVKILLPELTASLGGDRFLREIEVGKLLQHPNIVGVLDSGTADGKLFYTMPFIEGASLRDLLSERKQLSIDEAISLTREVAEALSFAHSKGIIHRDIKPENILLSGGHALVADFGIARAVTVAGGETLTKTGMAVGTPTYMSPEQALGSKDVTPESDIYSLACVLYEMLAGQPPFTAPTAMALLARHSLDNVPSLKIVRGTVPDAVEDAILRAMAKVPADRFRTTTDFANALTDHEGAAERRRNSLRATALPATTVADAPVAGARPRKRLGLIAAVAVPLIAAAGFFAWKSFSAPPADPRLAAMQANDIAVLYFEDRSPKGELQYLADGLTEALIHELGQVSALHVTSRNGVAPFKGKAVAPDSVARALKVGTVVSGTVQQRGDEIRVQFELIDARTGKEHASKRIDKPAQEGFALEDELVREVSDELRQAIGETVQVLVTRASTKNQVAWDTYQRARQAATQGDSLRTAGDAEAAKRVLTQADSILAAASQADPRWSAPLALRGLLAYRLARLELATGGGIDGAKRWIESGLARADSAVINKPIADALDARGTLRYLKWLLQLAPPTEMERLLADAESDLVAATKTNVAQATAMNTLSHLYLATGRIVDGNLTAQNAYRADPYLSDANLTLWRLFTSSVDLNNGQQAKQWCDEGASRFGSDFRFIECRLWLLTLEGQSPPPTADSIWATYARYVEANKSDDPEFAKRRGMLLSGIALVRAGLPDSARAVASRAQGNERIDPGGDLLWLEAVLRAQVGDKDRAISLYGRFLAAQPQVSGSATREDESWWFDNIKDEPRYKALMGSK